MEILAVIVLMGDGVVAVLVAVGAGGHRVVPMPRVTVVVAVEVLVVERFVPVAVLVLLREV